MYIDSHCHLNHERIAPLGPAETIIKNAEEAGLDGMLTVCCQIHKDFQDILQTARQFDNVWCSVGTHPHDAGHEQEKAITRQELVKLATSDPNVIAIGESGLDYYYNNSPADDQKQSFRKHIQACIETDLPLIVHARDADDDIITILKEEGAGTELKGVMHCFSSTRALGEAALELGFHISFSGIITFKKAGELRDFAKDVPQDKILIETDAPFLAPEPHRGKVNEPALVIHTGRVLAELHNITEEELARQTTTNFFTLFDKAKKG